MNEESQKAYAQERERLLHNYQQRLAATQPANHESAWQEFSEEWAQLAQQRGADRSSLRFLLYCTEWASHKGGIVAVNRNLAEGLASAGHEVFVRVGHEVPPDSPDDRIHLIGPRRHDPNRGEQEQLAYDGEDLPSDVDAIIGHSRYSGPEALQVRDERYPNTPFVQVVHMVTGALARVANRPDLEMKFEGIERRMVAAADMVAGVGPVLELEARRLAATNPGDHVPAIHQIIPGTSFEEQQFQPWDGERTRHILLVGRADAPQKGAHHAALMVRSLLTEGVDVQLTVRGSAPKKLEDVRRRLTRIAGREVVVKPFTIDRNEILADMRQADVLVMPSEAEGFGLVGLEAAGAGLPVLVPSSSGVGAFFGNPGRFPPEITRLNLVKQGFEDPVDFWRWTDHLREILGDLPRARQNALALQQLLREANTTWVGAAQSLAAAIQEIPDRRAPRPQAPLLSEIQSLNLPVSLAASSSTVQADRDTALSSERSTTEPAVAAVPPTSAIPLPAHPATGAHVIARETLERGDGIANRELVTFDNGTRAVYEKYTRTEDAKTKVLDAYVGRAVGARVPLSHLVGLREVYTDHVPGRPTSARHQTLAEQGMPATRDGVFLGLYHALTATHGAAVSQRAIEGQQSLVAVGDGSSSSHGSVPEVENPFVRTFYRQVEPRVFSWVDNPMSPRDIAVIRRQLDGLRPLFEQFGRPDLHDAVTERFGQVAEHAVGSESLLPRRPDTHVTLPDATPERHYPLPPPPDSRQRVDNQQAADALLTDDGRVADTSQAKTIAIQAVAERMWSSTPELACAAFGQEVGTDMVNRLGDGRYVLAPRHEQYPSIGADVLHSDKLDPTNPRHSQDKLVRMDDPYAETLVRQIAVSEIMKAWGNGADNNARSLALQETAKEEFGLNQGLGRPKDGRLRKHLKNEINYNSDALRDFLRTQYELTQEALARHGIAEVIAYQVVTPKESDAQLDWASLRAGDLVEAPRHRPLTTWTTAPQAIVDQLARNGGRAAVMVDRIPARYILSTPLTGMGYLPHKELVALPGNRPVLLDGVYTGRTPAVAAEQTMASSAALNTPRLSDAARNPASNTAEQPALAPRATRDHWQPLTVTAPLDPANPIDSQISRVLDGEEEFPRWWPRDDSGYAITKRDLDYLGIKPVQVKWMLTGEAPMGMTPELYQQFCAEMLEAIGRDGTEPSQVDIRLRGTGAVFFAGLHKTLPSEEDMASNPEARRSLREWFGDSQNRPLRRPFDCMWRLGLESVPSDVDLDINSTNMIRIAGEYWRTHRADRHPSDFRGGHGQLYLDEQMVMGAFSGLAEWTSRWERELGRPISLGIFESSGPFDATVLDRSLSSHFQDTDWVIHSPERPMAWRTPRSTITVRSMDDPVIDEAFKAVRRAQQGVAPPGKPAHSYKAANTPGHTGIPQHESDRDMER